jgi:hypothetical protein
MKNLAILISVLFIQNIQSQETLKDVIDFINNKKLTEFDTIIKPNSDSIFCNNFVEFKENKNLNKLSANENGFYFYKKLNLIKVKSNKRIYFANVINYLNYKLIVFNDGNFIIFNPNTKNSLFLENKYEMTEVYPNTVKGIVTIYCLDENLDLLSNVSLDNDGKSYTFSFFKIKNKQLYEQIFIEKPNSNNKYNDFNNKKIESIFFILTQKSSTFNFYRTILTIREFNKNSFFWFLNNNYEFQKICFKEMKE